MGLFGAIVRTVVNVTTELPVAIVKDACTLGGTLTDEESATRKALEKIKEEAEDDE